MLKKVRRAIIGLVIVNTLILMVLSAWGGYYYASTQIFSEFDFQIEEFDEIFSSAGLVSEKGKDYIKLDDSIIVHINEDTSIINLNLDEEIPIDLIPLESFVIVDSETNIKDLTEFTASIIRIIG